MRRRRLLALVAAVPGALLLQGGRPREVLVLGGTRFVGRHIAAAMLARGDRVTLFNRGRTAPGLFPAATELHGDRGGDLEVLRGRNWDLVVDSSGTRVDHVRRSVARLRDATSRYVYISSVAVYRPGGALDCREDAVLKLPAAERAASYGETKILCEAEVLRGFGERAVIVRPAVLVGPHDSFDRFARWLLRARVGGSMLVPGPPELALKITDARDLGAWIAGADDLRGVYNVAGAEHTMGELIAGCVARTRTACTPVWVDGVWLRDQEVDFNDVPPRPTSRLAACGSGRALAAGLRFRGLDETLDDTLAWIDGDPGRTLTLGALGLPREIELLAAWQARGG